MSRRKFIRNLGLTGLTVAGLPNILSAVNDNEQSHKNSIGEGLKILFQGDSITDGNRTRNNDWNHVMGHGYAYLIASRLWFDYIGKDLMFYNRGISGNKIQDLDDRWQEDTIDLKPDVLSILIGVNDIPNITENKNSISNWETTYRKVLDRTKEALPDTKIILCEPFALPTDDMERITWTKERTESYKNVISKMHEIVGQLADTYDAVFVELQQAFTEACKKAPARYWIWDGIHPMPAGHELIARTWLKKAMGELDFTGNG